jgi:hypothetical protein
VEGEVDLEGELGADRRSVDRTLLLDAISDLFQLGLLAEGSRYYQVVADLS